MARKQTHGGTLYEAGYRQASFNAAAKGGILDRYTVAS